MTLSRLEDLDQVIKFFRYPDFMATLPVVQCCAPLGEPALTDEEVAQLEQVFKALADRHRVRILNRLLAASGDAVCVCDFEDMLGLKQSTVSYHLKQLLDAGIIEREKRGSYAYFSLTPGALERVRELLELPVAA
jgi:ArsR family transcriptional regulator, arsenate/arsenite/antimonite-responsive transcriptional repressor